MKKVIVLLAATLVLSLGAKLYAGDHPADAKTPMCCTFLEHSEMLTPEQKTKAVALHDDCAKAHCAADAQAKFFKQVKLLLTPEQIAACKANCAKNHREGCPICSEPKSKS